MDESQKDAGEMPVQDKALTALAALLAEVGEEAGAAWLRDGPGDNALSDDCRRRAEAVVRCIVSLPAVTLQGASAKVRAVRTRLAVVLLPRDLVDALASDMHRDVTRLRAPTEAAGHA